MPRAARIEQLWPAAGNHHGGTYTAGAVSSRVLVRPAAESAAQDD